MLSERPFHGYELRQEVEDRLYAKYINLSGGSLYYNLRQLEQDGYVEKTKVEQMGNYPNRHVYQITPAGRDHLQAEVRHQLFNTKGRAKAFDPLNAALAFGHLLDDADLRDGIQNQLEWTYKRMAWVTEQHAYWSDQGITLPQAQILEHGIAYMRGEIAWLEGFLAKINERDNGGLKTEGRSGVLSSDSEETERPDSTRTPQ